MSTIKNAAIALSAAFALTTCKAPEDNKPTYVAPTINKQTALDKLAKQAVNNAHEKAAEMCENYYALKEEPAKYRHCFERISKTLADVNAVEACPHTTACDTEKLIASIKSQDHKDRDNAPTITP